MAKQNLSKFLKKTRQKLTDIRTGKLSEAMQFAKGGDVEPIAFKTSNLYLNGDGVDSNGNHVVKVSFPNDRAFSIQTNGVLKDTNSILKSVRKISGISDDDMKLIEREVNEYVRDFGSAKQKKKLHIYNKESKSENMAKGGKTEKIKSRMFDSKGRLKTNVAYKVKVADGSFLQTDGFDIFYSRGWALKKARIFNGKIEKHIPKYAILGKDDRPPYKYDPYFYFDSKELADKYTSKFTNPDYEYKVVEVSQTDFKSVGGTFDFVPQPTSMFAKGGMGGVAVAKIGEELDSYVSEKDKDVRYIVYHYGDNEFIVMVSKTGWEAEPVGDAIYKHQDKAIKYARKMAGVDPNKPSANPLYVGQKVYIGFYRKRFVIVGHTNELWANEFFKTKDDAIGFAKSNKLKLISEDVVEWDKKTRTPGGHPIFEPPKFEKGGSTELRNEAIPIRYRFKNNTDRFEDGWEVIVYRPNTPKGLLPAKEKIILVDVDGKVVKDMTLEQAERYSKQRKILLRPGIDIVANVVVGEKIISKEFASGGSLDFVPQPTSMFESGGDTNYTLNDAQKIFIKDFIDRWEEAEEVDDFPDEAKLIKEWEDYCKENNLPVMDAYELLAGASDAQIKFKLTDEQKEYVQGFIDRWEKLEKEDPSEVWHSELVPEWQKWLDDNDLPQWSADEILAGSGDDEDEQQHHDETGREEKISEYRSMAKSHYEKAQKFYFAGHYAEQDAEIEKGWEYELMALAEDTDKFNGVYKNPDVTILYASREHPLSTQLMKLTGDSYNMIDFDGDAGVGSILTHKKTGNKFTVLNEKQKSLVEKYSSGVASEDNDFELIVDGNPVMLSEFIETNTTAKDVNHISDEDVERAKNLKPGESFNIDFVKIERPEQEFKSGGQTKYWIHDAIGHPGALKAKAKKMGLINDTEENLSTTDLHALEEVGGKTAKEAHLAETLNSFHKRMAKGGSVPEDSAIVILRRVRDLLVSIEDSEVNKKDKSPLNYDIQLTGEETSKPALVVFLKKPSSYWFALKANLRDDGRYYFFYQSFKSKVEFEGMKFRNFSDALSFFNSIIGYSDFQYYFPLVGGVVGRNWNRDQWKYDEGGTTIAEIHHGHAWKGGDAEAIDTKQPIFSLGGDIADITAEEKETIIRALMYGQSAMNETMQRNPGHLIYEQEKKILSTLEEKLRNMFHKKAQGGTMDFVPQPTSMFAKGGKTKLKDNPKILLEDILRTVTEDDFKEGAQMETSQTYELRQNLKFETPKAMFEFLHNKMGLSADPKDYNAFEDGRLEYSRSEDQYGNPVKEGDHIQSEFKRGKAKLYIADFSIYVSYIQTSPIDIATLKDYFGAVEYEAGGTIADQVIKPAIAVDKPVLPDDVSQSMVMKKGGTTMPRIPNIESRAYVENKLPFEGHHMEGKLLSNGDYLVQSWGFYPLWWYSTKENKWYGNADKYSQTTLVHMSQSRPSYDATMISMHEMFNKMKDGDTKFDLGGHVIKQQFPMGTDNTTIAHSGNQNLI